MKTAIQLIADERRRQIFDLGKDANHDADQDRGQLLEAGLCYMAIALARIAQASEEQVKEFIDKSWPWEGKRPEMIDAAANLTKAGALLAAELDRLIFAGKVIPKDPDDEDDEDLA